MNNKIVIIKQHYLLYLNLTWQYWFEGSVIDAALVLESHKVLLVFCVGTVDVAHPVGGFLVLSIHKVAWLPFLVDL